MRQKKNLWAHVRNRWIMFWAIVILFSIFPISVWADDVGKLVLQINQISGLSASAEGNNVYVKGERTSSAKLELNIDAGIVVKWGAIYHSTTNPAINFIGDGTFEVIKDGSVEKTGTGSAINSSGFYATIIVNGGSISSSTTSTATPCYSINATGSNASIIVIDGNVSVAIPHNGLGNAIHATGSNASITVRGGNVYATDTGSAIYATGENASVVVNGGQVKANSGTAILMTGLHAMVTTSGNAKVYTYSENNTQTAIHMKNSANNIPNVFIKDNSVIAALSTFGNGYAIQSYGDIEIMDNAEVYALGEGTPTNSGTGRAINALGATSTVKVSSGAVWTKMGSAIHTTNVGSSVTISGGNVYNNNSSSTYALVRSVIYMEKGGTVDINGNGKVQAFEDGGIAIYCVSSGNITISGNGIVTSTTNTAIYVTAGVNVTVNGGFLFAYGKAISGDNNVVRMGNTGSFTANSPGVVVAWDQDEWNKNGQLPYESKTYNDLIFSPNGATAEWAINGAEHGIAYSNGENVGFYQLPVTVIAKGDGIGNGGGDGVGNGNGDGENGNNEDKKDVIVTKPSYTVTVIDGLGSGTYETGETVNIIAKQELGRQQFVGWEIIPAVSFVNSLNHSSLNAHFIMPDYDVMITAIYEYTPSIKYGIGVLNNGNGIASASESSASMGKVITLTAKANEGYRFTKWIVNKGHVILSNETDNPAQFRMRNFGVEVIAIFEEIMDDNEERRGEITGINELQQPKTLKAYVQDGLLVVSGGTQGAALKVYTINGMLIYQSDTTQTGFETLFGCILPGRGIFIVTDGKETVKVIY